MRLLRLLLWLRFKLWWRALTISGRWVGVVAPLALLALFWPVWAGGAFGAWWAVRELGAAAFPLVAGAVQMAWISTSVLAASVGRALAPRDLLRWPVRPGALFAFNAAAGAFEPATLVLVPPLVALIVAAFVMRGATAGAAMAVGVALSLGVTLVALQVLLSVLERMLRTEWMRMLSRLLLALVFLGVSWSYSELAETHLAPALAQRAPLRGALIAAAAWVERVPTVGAPAAVADAAAAGAARAAGGFAACLALIAALGALGTRLMRRTAVEPEIAAAGAGSTGAVDAVAGLTPHRLANLVRFDLLVQARSPRGLLWVLLTPLLISGFYLVHPSTSGHAPLFALVMTTTTLSQVSLMLYAHWGPGIRTLHLLPVPARDVVLARNLTFLLETALLLGTLGALFALMRTGLRPAQLPLWLAAAAGTLAVMLTVGNALSIRHPVRISAGWGGQRSVGIVPTLASFAANGAAASAMALSAWSVRRLVSPPWGEPAAALVVALEAAAAVFVWWRSLDRAAEAFVAGRERMIEALAKDSAAS